MADKASLHLEEKWDKLIDLSLRRTTYGLIVGGAASLLLFRTSPGARTALISFAVGAGAGSGESLSLRHERQGHGQGSSITLTLTLILFSAFQLCSSEFEDLVPSLLKEKLQK